MSSRLLVFLIVAPICVLLAVVIAYPVYPLESGLLSIATSANGFTSLWYFVGIGDARGFALVEALPRAIATAVAAACMVAGAPLFVYALLLIASSIFSLSFLYRKFCNSERISLNRQTLETILKQVHLTSSRLAKSFYLSGATAIVAAVTPLAASIEFAVYGRLMSSIAMALTSFPQAIQSWVSKRGQDDYFRQRRAFLADVAFSITVTTFGYVSLPFIIAYMFSDEVATTPHMRVLVSLAVGLTNLSYSVSLHILVPAGHARYGASLMTATYTLAAAGVVVFGWIAGAQGAFLCIVVAETTLIALGLVKARRIFQREVASR